MPFPSVLSTFNRPTATNRLDNPSHSALHNTVSSAVGQIEAVIGVEGPSSVVGTLEYFIKSPASDGGGHVQTANRGGTGQTSFNKGDILVALSSSVITKLAVSSTTSDVLVADSTQAAGMKWATNPNANKIAVSNSVVAFATSVGSAQPNVLFASSIFGSTLGTNNAIRFTGQIPKFNMEITDSFNLVVNYGPNVVASMTFASPVSILGAGKIEGMIINNSASSQNGYVTMFLGRNSVLGTAPQAVSWGYGYGYGNASINSTANQDLVITGKYGVNNSLNSILTGFFVVEKIS